MRIVLDTNVLVSALLSPHGPPSQVLQLVLGGEVTLCHDLRILEEYRQVLLCPKFPFRQRNVQELLDYLEGAGDPVAPLPLGGPMPDADDAAFLEVAIAGGATHLVTGNARHFPARLRAGVSVVSPAEFLRHWRGATS